MNEISPIGKKKFIVTEEKLAKMTLTNKALDTRQKVLFASQENTAGPCYNHDLVQSMFIRSYETGFQDDNVASKMRSVLKDKNIADEDRIEKLMQRMSDKQNCIQLVRQRYTRSSMQQLQHMLCLVTLK